MQVLDIKNEILYKSVRRSDKEIVDRIVKLAKGPREMVKTDSDWAVFLEILNVFLRKFPQEALEFEESVNLIRQTRANEKGYSPSKELKYLAALPLRFMKMIRVIFPLQPFDKEFIYEMIKRVKLFRIGQ